MSLRMCCRCWCASYLVSSAIRDPELSAPGSEALALNRIRAHWHIRRPVSGQQAIEDRLRNLEDPHSPLSQLWDDDHDRHVAETLLQSIRLEFQLTTWYAFERTVRDGRPTAEVATELGLTENAVLIAKSRVIKRLRQKAAGLIE